MVINMKNLAISALLVMMVNICCAQSTQSNSPDSAQSRINSLINNLHAHRVERVEILNIPAYILTMAAVAPSSLEENFFYKFIITTNGMHSYSATLESAVLSTSVQPASEMGDMRWGVIFYDSSGHRVGSIYYDSSGQRGAVDSFPVLFKGGFFKGNLFKWLESNFSTVFK